MTLTLRPGLDEVDSCRKVHPMMKEMGCGMANKGLLGYVLGA